ncbi:aspartyl/glutamyl-tRNA amidotransferase A subunit [Candidatus Carsonella ruddii HT isolate Thao2000]|uniref:Aspartyl/glutamyl-tRNA amidotransferase A subunit n=1 Tax=Candidatus Carsonella ruddii HT isolate Thao2000 TaxID=1202539 RepID=J3Z1F6_CARRU|nr:amidase family protein [Candidatus Carsonella ruddii]AFP84089.1 aspartyl/glutamyl-tRNA amidotransferase A subunit [Candidatus Carsonella ruddii HT isolate Thao2000]
MNYLCKIGIKKIYLLLKNKIISNYELVKNCLNNLYKLKIKNNFNIDIFFKESLNFAKIIDKKKLISIPISIKNIFNIKNKKLTCNSKILKKYKSNFNSSIINVIKKKYFNILSIDNCDEFCVGGTGLNNCDNYNIYNKKYISGGSSSGSSINISFSGNLISIGSDTGGSIRTPCSFLNLIGFKPTNGSISRYGMVSYSSYLDNCSIISNNVEDCFYLFKILNNKNIDINCNKNYFKICKKKKLLIIDYKELFLELEYINIFNNIIYNFEKLNFNISKIKLNFNSFLNLYESISAKEFYSNSLKFDGIKFGFKKKIYKNINDYIKLNRIFSYNTKLKILKGNNFLNNYNLKIDQIKKMKILFEKIFLNSDFLIIPTNIKHFKIKNNFFDLIDIFTTFSNILGYPSINIRSNFKNHLPIGFQIISNKNFDYDLLNIAFLYENMTFNNYVY